MSAKPLCQFRGAYVLNMANGHSSKGYLVTNPRLMLQNSRFWHPMPLFTPRNPCSLNRFEPHWQLLNLELDLWFGSAIFENSELNFGFSSGWFRFEPKFRTELIHHYGWKTRLSCCSEQQGHECRDWGWQLGHRKAREGWCHPRLCHKVIEKGFVEIIQSNSHRLQMQIHTVLQWQHDPMICWAGFFHVTTEKGLVMDDLWIKHETAFWESILALLLQDFVYTSNTLI
jgi:hypothetical protein